MEKIHITVLGSGTCVPDLRRHSCSLFAKAGRGRLLLDTGVGTMKRLLEAGESIFDVTHIFYSHLHPDHTGELAALLFSLKYAGDLRRKTPLTIVGARGIKAFYENLKSAYGRWIGFEPGMLAFVELSPRKRDAVAFDGFRLETVPVEHTDQSIAARITAPGGSSFVYSGDTDYSENLVELSQDTDLLVCESAHPDEFKVPGHLCPSLAGEIATRARVKKLLLTHFYPVCDSVDMKMQCRKTYGGDILLAEDLMTLIV